ncbi:hypothetical protein ESCO_005593 [Escovopsis weberi]|uniref:CENP-V/GFA domain-containing protein n=1 Tax=Escovopsis weberi TaxID=150374 RepID=A0A0M9VUK3_ESCWE|nr:hypothetical protein ESCO_005593 [Escovopsis weberi]
MKDCDCSICTRIAWAGVYANKAQVRLTGTEHAQEYRFGREFTGHPFCKTCGAHVYMNLYGPPQHLVDGFPEEKKAQVRAMLDLKPVNVRHLENVDLGALAIERNVEGTDGYERDVLGLED